MTARSFEIIITRIDEADVCVNFAYPSDIKTWIPLSDFPDNIKIGDRFYMVVEDSSIVKLEPILT
jgi:hypothetical protein